MATASYTMSGDKIRCSRVPRRAAGVGRACRPRRILVPRLSLRRSRRGRRLLCCWARQALPDRCWSARALPTSVSPAASQPAICSAISGSVSAEITAPRTPFPPSDRERPIGWGRQADVYRV